MYYLLIIIETMINLYPYLCDDPDMDLSPIREKSERLYRDILRERAFYAEHPECQNVHFFHEVKQNAQSSIWVDRWGVAVLSYKYGRWQALRGGLTNSAVMRRRGNRGYFYISVRVKNGWDGLFIHQLMANAFLPNTDFTKCQMDHLNGEHLDNNALNLERVTPEENIRRREVNLCLKKNKPIPEKYRTPENYLIYLQSKKQSK